MVDDLLDVARVTHGKVTLRRNPVELQVFTNLLTNAIKYTPAGGQVRVRLERSAAEVEDTGVGIAPGALETIFEVFAQVDESLDRRRAASASVSRSCAASSSCTTAGSVRAARGRARQAACG